MAGQHRADGGTRSQADAIRLAPAVCMLLALWLADVSAEAGEARPPAGSAATTPAPKTGAGASRNAAALGHAS